jgi:hypothetical protein
MFVGLGLILTLFVDGRISSAQSGISLAHSMPFQTQVPAEPMMAEKNILPESARAILSVSEIVPWPEPKPGVSSISLPESSSSNSNSFGANIVSSRRSEYVAQKVRVIDKRYLLLNGLHLGMGILDVALTQHCIASGRCREGNPLMPSSMTGQLGVNFGYFAYGSLLSYKLKRRHAHFWWISPVSGIASHSVGIASGITNH